MTEHYQEPEQLSDQTAGTGGTDQATGTDQPDNDQQATDWKQARRQQAEQTRREWAALETERINQILPDGIQGLVSADGQITLTRLSDQSTMPLSVSCVLIPDFSGARTCAVRMTGQFYPPYGRSLTWTQGRMPATTTILDWIGKPADNETDQTIHRFESISYKLLVNVVDRFWYDLISSTLPGAEIIYPDQYLNRPDEVSYLTCRRWQSRDGTIHMSIPAQGWTIIHGVQGHGKSLALQWILTDLCRPDTEPGLTAVILETEPDGTTEPRIKEQVKAGHPANIALMKYPDIWSERGRTEVIELLMDVIPDIVAVDSMNYILAPDQAENSADSWINAYRRINNMVRMTGTNPALIGISHNRKPAPGKKFELDLRGSSAISAGANLTFQALPDDLDDIHNGNKLLIPSGKYRVRVPLNMDGLNYVSRAVDINNELLFYPDYNGPATDVPEYYQQAQQQGPAKGRKPKPPSADDIADILIILRDSSDGLTTGTIANKLGKYQDRQSTSKPYVQACLEQAEKDGSVRQVIQTKPGTDRTITKWFYIPPGTGMDIQAGLDY